jgi:competence protein ComEC
MDRENPTQSASSKDKLILTALWSFISGILAATLISLPPLVAVLILVVAGAIWLSAMIYHSGLSGGEALIVIALVGFGVGVFRYDIKDFHELAPAGDTGIVVSEPERRDADTRFVVETDSGEKILVSTDIFSEVKYGDKLRLRGNAKALKPGGYADYLAKDDIFYTMDYAKVEVLSIGHGNPVIETLLDVKGAFIEKVREILPEPGSSLLSGLIVSGKQALPKENLEEFRRAGLVHIVVLSGYNITIIAEFLLILFAFLGVRRAAVVSAVGVLLFVLMSGAPATVMRGAVMVLLMIFGKIFGREGSAPRILLFTAAVMLMFNPKALVYDASFQLSFLAMLGIIYGTPLMERWLARLPERFGLRSVIATTLATQAFVLPFILYNMGNFSLVFLLSNVLVLLILPITMLVGFMATLLAFVSGILAWPVALVTHLLLSWVLFVADFLGNLSFASVEIENFPPWGSLLVYSALVSILWLSRNSLPHSSSSSS